MNENYLKDLFIDEVKGALHDDCVTEEKVEEKIRQAQLGGEGEVDLSMYAKAAEVTQLKSDFDEHTHTASDVGAMAQKTGYITGTIKEFVKSLKGNASGMVAYSDVSDASSEIPDGFLLYNRTDGFSGFVYFMAFYMGRFKFGHYDTITDEINWGYGSDSFLPLTGGTLTGNSLGLRNGLAKLTAGDDFAQLESYKGTAGDTNNRRLVALKNSNDIANALQVIDWASGISKYYNVYGDHNKTRGSYTGNGQSGDRHISTGGLGSVIAIWGHAYFSLVGEYGGFSVYYDGNMVGLKNSDCTFVNGILYLRSASERINGNGLTYYYQVL